MSDSPLNIKRDLLAKALGGNYEVIRTFEQIVNDVGGFPSTIEEANALAGSALAVAQSAIESLAMLAEVIAQLESAPATSPHIPEDDALPAIPEYVPPDDTTPAVQLGTLAAQNADSLEVTGPITSTVATGTAPFVIASTTRVANLNVARAGRADSLGTASSYPEDATDLPTVIALANALKAANQAKGV